VAKSTGLKPGEVGEHRYPWQNPGDPKARMKIARLMYFEPWDWIIGAGSYEEEFLESATRSKQLRNRSKIVLWSIAGSSPVIIRFPRSAGGPGIANPIINIANAVNTVARDRDLTIEVPVGSKDEVGVMAGEFNKMMRLLRESFQVVTKAARDVENYSGDVAQRASANRERAERRPNRCDHAADRGGAMRATAGRSGRLLGIPA
jgi:methyl-accepting chemotaxis protein